MDPTTAKARMIIYKRERVPHTYLVGWRYDNIPIDPMTATARMIQTMKEARNRMSRTITPANAETPTWVEVIFWHNINT